MPHTPAPWAIEMGSTCSAAWPQIVKEWEDEKGEPWKEEVCQLPSTYVFDYEKHGREIATTYNDRPELFKPYDGESTHEERVANARLIAAAPDLLEACQAAQQCIADFLEVYKNGGSILVMDEAVKSLKSDAGKLVEAAIRKATQ